MGSEVLHVDIPFAPCLAALRSTPTSTRVTLRAADQVDPDALFALDTALRRSTPGNAGWAADRALFDDELAGPEFDPSGYLIAEDRIISAAVGLVRFWRNDPRPKLGLVGVLPGWRDGRVAATLLTAATEAAATWGSPSFRTHTAHPSLQRRLLRLGARPCR